MKRNTHYLAGATAAVWAFSATPAGVTILQQYPKLASVFGAVTTILALYFNPKNGGNDVGKVNPKV